MEEWGHISAPYSLGPTEPTSLPHPLPPPQALEKLQFLYLADNLLDAIPQSLPLSLRSLHLQAWPRVWGWSFWLPPLAWFMGYLLSATTPDLGRGVAPLGHRP